VTNPGKQSDPEVRVRLQPRARRNEIVGEREGVLVVRVTAPPVEGKANDALCRLIAKEAGVVASRVKVVRGASSRNKVVRVHGVESAVLRRALRLGRWATDAGKRTRAR
jgi:uncharacterized protein (TIGR00251 family)